MNVLAELRRTIGYGALLPSQRFFTAKPEFFDILKGLEGPKVFIEAGCGMGDTTTQAKARGLQMIGVDVAYRAGQADHVLMLDATIFTYAPTTWLLMCRPNHDGWSYDAAERALQMGASVLYVGFAKNHRQDLGRLAQFITKRWPVVGDEGERMVLLDAEAYRAPRKKRVDDFGFRHT